MSEEIKKAYKLFNREDLIDDGYERDLDSNIQVFLTTKQMINYMNLQQKVEQLENIIDVKKYDYDYLETLFSKSSKEEVLKAYTYKCEQLERVTETRNKFQMKSMQLENIRKEAIEYIHNHQLVFELSSKKQIQYWFDAFYKDLLNILNKGSDKE